MESACCRDVAIRAAPVGHSYDDFGRGFLCLIPPPSAIFCRRCGHGEGGGSRQWLARARRAHHAPPGQGQEPRGRLAHRTWRRRRWYVAVCSERGRGGAKGCAVDRGWATRATTFRSTKGTRADARCVDHVCQVVARRRFVAGPAWEAAASTPLGRRLTLRTFGHWRRRRRRPSSDFRPKWKG